MEIKKNKAKQTTTTKNKQGSKSNAIGVSWGSRLCGKLDSLPTLNCQQWAWWGRVANMRKRDWRLRVIEACLGKCLDLHEAQFPLLWIKLPQVREPMANVRLQCTYQRLVSGSENTCWWQQSGEKTFSWIGGRNGNLYHLLGGKNIYTLFDPEISFHSQRCLLMCIKIYASFVYNSKRLKKNMLICEETLNKL